MPVSHQCFPLCQTAIWPYHCHTPSCLEPNPRPLKMLIGTGSNNHTPPLAKSSTKNGAVKYSQTWAYIKLTVRTSQRGQCCDTPLFFNQPLVTICKAMPTA